jgi:hypothetical protein
MTRACIHLGMHNHPVSDGIYRETLDTISGLIAQEVSKTPTTKTSAIAMAASKEFFDKYLIHNCPRPKKMVWGQELEDVLDKFEHLSSPNLRTRYHYLEVAARKENMRASWLCKGTPQLSTSTPMSFQAKAKIRYMSSRCW